MTVESEEKKDVLFTGEEAQDGRRKSLIDTLRNQKEINKVAPEGVKKGQVIDVEEFKREMQRRGSINL